MCVLIVEDEPVILLAAAISLEDAGFEVMTADHGPFAVKLIAQHPGHFSALVTDHNMPHDMTGADVVVHMRQHYPLIPMVIATASQQAVSEDFRQRHRVHMLPKPYAEDALVKLMNGLLGR